MPRGDRAESVAGAASDTVRPLQNASRGHNCALIHCAMIGQTRLIRIFWGESVDLAKAKSGVGVGRRDYLAVGRAGNEGRAAEEPLTVARAYHRAYGRKSEGLTQSLSQR